MPTQWKKSPPELIAVFDAAIPPDPRVVLKPMFGYPALYLNGNMFAGTFQDKVLVRLAEADRSEVLRRKRASPFEPMPGRPMKEYVVVPASVVARPKELAAWIERGLAYASGLPPKASGRPASP